MRNMFKNNKAITLIALIITIVVLIILATVVINLSLGQNGLFNKAKIASQEYKNAQDEENIKIAEYSNNMDSVAGNRAGVSQEEYDRLKAAYDQLLERKIEFVGMYKSSTYVSRTSSSSITIPDVEPGEYIIVGFKTFSEGAENETHLHTNDPITSITNATFTSTGDNKTVYRMTVTEKSNVVVTFPASHSNERGNGGYSYVWLFK